MSTETNETDAWAELQALKFQRESRRRKLEERKKGILSSSVVSVTGTTGFPLETPGGIPSTPDSGNVSGSNLIISPSASGQSGEQESSPQLALAGVTYSKEDEEELENLLLRSLCETALNLPIDSKQLQASMLSKESNTARRNRINHEQLCNLLQKFSVQKLINIQKKITATGDSIEILSAEHTKLTALVGSLPPYRKRKVEALEDNEFDRAEPISVETKKTDADDVLSLLSMDSTKERENKRIGEEILELLSRPTAKEKNLAEQFRSQGGTSVREFCPHGTKVDCRKVSANNRPCGKVHFRKIIQGHTDETLGDCSFLNTCFHMESCKYVHYEVDKDTISVSPTKKGLADGSEMSSKSKTVLHPPQWVHCDLRFFDMTVLGKFSVIMADPPWDIHMELPYGTLSDDEMRQLNIPSLQDDGLIFLWVTGRAMELGRECLQLWGYERVDELIWVKTNQLQRIIRTGRTGHWLNHGKEHCLVGMKGNPQINRGLDSDIIVAEVRATSHKPDEIYGIIERLSPGTRKIELFGRSHNIQPNWVTLGNQLEGSHIVDEDIKRRFHERYPDGNCMQK